MARKRPIDRYHQGYSDLMTRASYETVTVPFETPAQARSFRNEIYAFRSVLYSLTGDDAVEYEDVAQAAQNVRFLVQGKNLIAEPIRPPAKD